MPAPAACQRLLRARSADERSNRGFVPVVVPSRREGYGVVAREAMAHGRPVVASAVGGLVDAVEDGVTGILVPPGDAVALREAVKRLLADVALRERLGRAAAREAIERFSRRTALQALLAVYETAS